MFVFVNGRTGPARSSPTPLLAPWVKNAVRGAYGRGCSTGKVRLYRSLFAPARAATRSHAGQGRGRCAMQVRLGRPECRC